MDIKPHNILQDENLTLKIADFGLAKICSMNESIVALSNPKGTDGYVAPKVRDYEGSISKKYDVFSYSQILLEIVGVKFFINQKLNNPNEKHTPIEIYAKLVKDGKLRLEGMKGEEIEIVKRMTTSSLWCIKMSQNQRPTMNSVIDVLEGNWIAISGIFSVGHINVTLIK